MDPVNLVDPDGEKISGRVVGGSLIIISGALIAGLGHPWIGYPVMCAGLAMAASGLGNEVGDTAKQIHDRIKIQSQPIILSVP